MLRSEVEKITGLSRKALEYYESLGLIQPAKDENSYRNYSQADVVKLEKISLFRNLGFSLSEIDGILDKGAVDSSILRKRQYMLDQAEKKNALVKRLIEGEDLEQIKRELEILQRNESIYDKLERIFPGYFGQLLFAAYKPFFQDPLPELGEKAFNDFVAYLDQLPSIDLSQEEINFLEEASSFQDQETLDQVNQEKIAAVKDPSSWLEENQEALEAYEAYKNSQAYKESPAKALNDKLVKFMTDNNYYQVAIPLIRAFSPAYNSYYEKLLKADQVYRDQKKDLA
ncbi:MAG: MerR family transcriptional regulator [Bacillota bacterium]|nr:MerR family transcriptional regulator [Bacillota bacterium]